MSSRRHGSLMWRAVFGVLPPLLLAGAVSGCSAASDSAPAGGQTQGPFGKYCSGLLEADMELATPHPMYPGFWVAAGDTVQAGTEVQVARASLTSGSAWAGYAFRSDGTPLLVEPLYLGGSFSCACVTQDKLASDEFEFVLLRDSTFYESATLSGKSCEVPAGTKLGGFSPPPAETPDGFFNFQDALEASTPEITSMCGFAHAYSGDMVFGELALK